MGYETEPPQTKVPVQLLYKNTDKGLFPTPLSGHKGGRPGVRGRRRSAAIAPVLHCERIQQNVSGVS